MQKRVFTALGGEILETAGLMSGAYPVDQSASYQVLVVSSDRAVHRTIARLLEAVGCQVDALLDCERLSLLMATSQYDFVVVDGDLPEDQALKICRRLTEGEEDSPSPIVLFLVSGKNTALVALALSAGADDILHKPLNTGEVLARFRAASRLREQQRRRLLQHGRSDTPGFLPGAAWRALAKEVASQASGGAMVLLAFDHFANQVSLIGKDGGQRLWWMACERLQLLSCETTVWGELGGGILAALQPHADEVAAIAWAEQIRSAMAEKPFDLEGRSIRLSPSIGVSDLGNKECMAEDRARGALEFARRSGGNCAVPAMEWERERRRLGDQASWMECSSAWDIMLPCPLSLHSQDTVDQAAVLLSQTQLAHVPVVDATGRLLGLVSARSVQHGGKKQPVRGTGSIRFVRAVMIASPPEFSEDTSVKKVAEFFAGDPSPVAVVTRQGRPLGLIYSHALAALEERLSRRSFEPLVPFSLDTDYLVTCEPAAVED